MSLRLRIGAAALLLVGLLVGLVVRETAARAAGREVRLPMEAVDPRELLTGHYIDLQLTQAIPPGQSCPPGTEAVRNDPGWIALSPSPTGDRVSGFAATRPAAARLGQVTVKGRLFCYVGASDSPGRLTLDIGVRRFHADQRQAEAFDKALAERRRGEPPSAFAIVSVGADGTPRLKGVIIAGQRADLTWN